MLSQKLQKDLMDAYAAVHEEKRGHAAGDSDVEKQASQLASDVRYKAKGKVKQGASEEEKKKIFLQILGASPAPSAVKAMARQKLLGEEVVVEMSARETLNKKMKEKKVNTIIKKDAAQDMKTEKKLASLMMGEERFADGPEGTKKRLEKLAKKRGISMKKMKKHPQFQPEEFAKTGMSKGTGKAGGAMKKYLENAKKKKEKVKMEGYMSKDKYTHDTGGFRISQKDADEAKARIKKKMKMKKEETELVHGDYGNYVNGQKTEKREERPITPEQRRLIPEKKAAKDYDGDGKVESGTQEFLGSRDKAIKKAIAKRRGRVKEGFSAWRIDLDFNEQVKK